ncbi:MAG: DNA polymerase III subunit beta [Oscillospiraceae bacterium]|nr:DNA polymerase III subunit beta [Oscillospiraceae bacterium]
MKITFDKDLLIEAVGMAMSAVSNKNTIAAIEGILFTTDDNANCTLSSYDLEKGFRKTVEADVQEQGSWIINAGKLSRMIRTMTGDITITVNDRGTAKIKSGKSEFSTAAIAGEEFPAMPELTGEQSFILSGKDLRGAVNQVFHAVGNNDQMPELTGAFFDVKGNTLKLVGCDRNRLAIREKEITPKTTTEDEFDLSFIIPGRTLSELMKIAPDDYSDVEIVYVRRHVIFMFDDNIFFSRLIDKAYIDYEKVIPTNYKIEVTVDRAELIKSLERATLITEDKSLGMAIGYVKCEFTENGLVVSSNSTTSSMFDELAADKEGDDITIGFNCRFLLDALKAATGEVVKLTMQTPSTSMLITPVEDATPPTDAEDGDPTEPETSTETPETAPQKEEIQEKFLYMVFPVRMKEGV